MGDVPNWRDMVSKLLTYAQEELSESQRSEIHAARMAAMQRANGYLKEAVKVIDANGGATPERKMSDEELDQADPSGFLRDARNRGTTYRP